MCLCACMSVCSCTCYDLRLGFKLGSTWVYVRVRIRGWEMHQAYKSPYKDRSTRGCVPGQHHFKKVSSMYLKFEIMMQTSLIAF